MKSAIAILVALSVLTLSAQGAPGGIGAVVNGDAGGARIISVLPGGPADRAGLRAGDLILAVNDMPLVGLNGDAAVTLLRGAVGSPVRLAVGSARDRGRTVVVIREAVPQTAAPARGAAAAPRATRPPAPSPAASPITPSTGAVNPSFVTWIEPQERSFSLQVPRGWQVTGGLNWTGPIDPSMFIRAATADGQVQVFIGDPELLPRQAPSAITQLQTGVREGGVFRTPTGGRAMVQRFQTGIQFAKTHVTQRVCRAPRWLREADQPDVAREATASVAAEARAVNAQATASAGEIGFACDAAIGYTRATTVLAQSPGAPIQVWGVLTIAGFMSADQGRAIQARYVMEQMLATFTRDPAWEQAWEQRVRQVTGSVMAMQNAATQASLRAARNASDTLARLNRPNPGVSRPSARATSGVNTTLGTRDVCDAIGRCKTVSNDADTVFIDHSGNVAAGRAGGAPPDNSGVWAQMK